MRTILAVGLTSAALAVHGAEYRSVIENAAVLYDAPSRAAVPLYVVSRQYPLELIVILEHWVKVRDHTGSLSWIERRLVSERRTVVVTAPSAEVRVRPEDAAPISFVAVQNVALELVEVAPGGWLRVRHTDGSSGFLRASLVWGG